MGDGLQLCARRTATHEFKSGAWKGKRLAVTTLSAEDIASARDESLQEYRRDQIQATLRNIDLVPEEHRDETRRAAFAEAAKVQYTDLPDKRVRIETEKGATDIAVDYGLWWMSETIRGGLFTIWLASAHKQPDLTLDDVYSMFEADSTEMQEVAALITSLSDPKLPAGNGEAPTPGPTAEGRRARRRRRKKEMAK